MVVPPIVSLASCWARPWPVVASTPTSYRNTRPATSFLPRIFTYVAVSHTRAIGISAAANGGGGGDGDDDEDVEHRLTRPSQALQAACQRLNKYVQQLEDKMDAAERKRK